MRQGHDAEACSGESGGASDRRSFLSRLLLGFGGLLSGLFTGIGATFLIGSRGKGPRQSWTRVARVQDLRAGEPLNVEYLEVVPDAWATIRRRKRVWLVRRDDRTVTAFDPSCTHLGCPYDWDSKERLFKCPCHGGVFDIDGNVVSGPPPRPLDTLEERIEDGNLLIGTALTSRSEASA